jgi:hypothetical protein
MKKAAKACHGCIDFIVRVSTNYRTTSTVPLLIVPMIQLVLILLIPVVLVQNGLKFWLLTDNTIKLPYDFF